MRECWCVSVGLIIQANQMRSDQMKSDEKCDMGFLFINVKAVDHKYIVCLLL